MPLIPSHPLMVSHHNIVHYPISMAHPDTDSNKGFLTAQLGRFGAGGCWGRDGMGSSPASGHMKRKCACKEPSCAHDAVDADSQASLSSDRSACESCS